MDVTTSNDTINMIICGSVTAFSLFAIFEPELLLPSLSPASLLVITSLLALMGYRRSRG